jgi:hypothetical protein
MNLDGAKNAKAEIFEKVFRFEETPVAFSPGVSQGSFLPRLGSEIDSRIREGRLKRRLDPVDMIAVGFAVDPRREHQVSLALLLQSRTLLHHPIVEEAVRRVGDAEMRLIVTGPVSPRSVANGGRCRPLRIGASIGHVNVTAGSLGCFATCRKEGTLGFLSNNHVLADSNNAQAGDLIVQPGVEDGADCGDPATHVARLHRYHPIDFGPGATNYVDCAFAELIADVEHEPDRIGFPAGSLSDCVLGEPEDLVIDQMPVMKVGRTTGHTRGSVTVVSIDNVTTGYPGYRFARFDRQVAIRGATGPFSARGDSGALVVTQDGRPIALLFSGTSHGITYANPIQAVLDTLSVDIQTRP